MATVAAAPPQGDPPAPVDEAGPATEMASDPGSVVDALEHFEPLTAEIDLEADPLTSPVSASESTDWNAAFFSRFSPRTSTSPDKEYSPRNFEPS